MDWYDNKIKRENINLETINHKIELVWTTTTTTILLPNVFFFFTIIIFQFN